MHYCADRMCNTMWDNIVLHDISYRQICPVIDFGDTSAKQTPICQLDKIPFDMSICSAFVLSLGSPGSLFNCARPNMAELTLTFPSVGPETQIRMT